MNSPAPGDEEIADLFGDFQSDAEEAGKEVPSEPLTVKRPRAEERLLHANAAVGAEGASSSSGRRTKPEKTSKRRKTMLERPDASKYYELEAEEAGGSEDEQEDEDLEDLIDNSEMAPGEKGRAQLRKEMQRQAKELEELRKDAAQRGPLAGAARLFSSGRLDEMERKYKELEERGIAGEDLGPPEPLGRKETHTVTVPDPQDPKLWCCKTFGPERDLCICLMHKAMEVMAQGQQCPIYSVFFSPHLRGYIYIEAFKEADVRQFIKGIRGLSQWTGFALVPAAQMPIVFTASQIDAQKKTFAKVGDWVRVKRGQYGGDLALIEEVQDEIFTLKLKPRLQFGTEAAKRALKEAKGSAKRRPQQRWFNKADIEAAQEFLVTSEPRRTQQGFKYFYIVDGEAYRDGFLYKRFKGHWFSTGEAVRPQEHELQEWQNAPPISENTRPAKDLTDSKLEKERTLMPPPGLPVKVLSEDRPPLAEGDLVIVTSGDLKNLRGEVSKALFGSPTVLIRPLFVDGIEGQHISLAVNILCKYFEVGNYVKVVAGENQGDTGYITRVELGGSNENEWGPRATARVLSQSCVNEFSVKLDCLRLTTEKATPLDSIGEFRIGQLVHISGHAENRSIIVRLEAGSRAIVLGADGRKLCVDFAELEPVPLPNRRLYKLQTWCLDRKGQKITIDSVVKAPRSATTRSAPVKAKVIHIHSNTVFLEAMEGLTGEKAFLACPGDRCEYIWNLDVPGKGSGKGSMALLPEKDVTEPEMKQLQYGITMASTISFLKPNWHKKLGIDKPISKSGGTIIEKGSGVRITGGSYKGLRGEIRALLGERPHLTAVQAETGGGRSEPHCSR